LNKFITKEGTEMALGLALIVASLVGLIYGIVNKNKKYIIISIIALILIAAIAVVYIYLYSLNPY